MRTNLLKKTGAVLLTAAVAVGSVWSAPKQSKAADTKYVQIFSSGDVSVSAFEKNRMSLMLSVASRHILFICNGKCQRLNIILSGWRIFRKCND